MRTLKQHMIQRLTLKHTWLPIDFTAQVTRTQSSVGYLNNSPALAVKLFHYHWYVAPQGALIASHVGILVRTYSDSTPYPALFFLF